MLKGRREGADAYRWILLRICYMLIIYYSGEKVSNCGNFSLFGPWTVILFIYQRQYQNIEQYISCFNLNWEIWNKNRYFIFKLCNERRLWSNSWTTEIVRYFWNIDTTTGARQERALPVLPFNDVCDLCIREMCRLD